MGGVRILRVNGLFLAAGILVHAVPVSAQQYVDQCTDWQGKQFSIEARISGCTTAIQSGRWSGNDLAPAFFNRGLAYSRKGDTDRAIADYSEAIRLNPKHAKSYLGRGSAYLRKADWDRAIADYTEAIRLDPKNAPAYISRGSAYHQKRDSDSA